MKSLNRLLLICIIFCCLAFTSQTNFKDNITTVVIDVSHGGDDNGIQYDQLSEKEIVLQISQLIKEKNLNKHVKIRFTREIDETIELRERVAFINEIKPDLVLSLHIASHEESSVSGIEIFVAEKSKEYQRSNILAEKLKDKFISKNMDRDAEVKTANFFLMERSNHPVLTLELGFLTNETDRLILQNPEEQANIAHTILEFISEL